MQKKETRIIYYQDELNDEFSSKEIQAKKIDKNYKYIFGFSGKIWRFILYRLVMIPGTFIYLKCKFHHKIIGKEKFKEAKNKGYFIYGNHTQAIADAYIPTFVNLQKGTYVITHANNVSMKFLGKLTPYLGAIPLPDDLEATRNFLNCLKKRIEEKNAIVIYPERHIWPYYTKIRPFDEKSFTYPVKFDTPVFCFTNTYKKRRNSDKVDIVTYVDGPFYKDENLSMAENKKMLRDKVYNAMVKRSELNEVEFVEYRRKDND